jgi:hypothetical protein
MENLSLLPDDALLSGIELAVGDARRVLVHLLAYLAEIEARRLELRRGYSSLFDFCTTHLRMSPGEAQRRIVAARLMRRFPIVGELLKSGAVNITGLELLRPHLSGENHRELLDEASFKKKEEILELLARRFPRPDVPDTVRRVRAQQASRSSAHEGAPLRLEPSPGARSGTAPLSPDRYAVQFTASAALRDKLEHAKNLMRHANPSLDLAVVVERAVDLLIEKLEKRKLGKAARPQKPRPAKEGAVTQEARRAATARDGAQCAWVDEQTGRRCTARAFLEADHVHEKARGGSGKPPNIRWLCRAHNRLHAEQTFGREAVEAAMHHRQRKSIRSQKPPLSETGAKALVGLRKLGFREAPARDAVARVASELGERKEPELLELVLRQALLLLADSRTPRGWVSRGSSALGVFAPASIPGPAA